MNKIYVVIIGVALLVSFVGCNKSETQEESDTTTTNQSTVDENVKVFTDEFFQDVK